MLLSKQAFREDKNFTVCHSSAWASKMVTSAYWVYANQVWKTVPGHGELHGAREEEFLAPEFVGDGIGGFVSIGG